jgi:hypothetical protein
VFENRLLTTLFGPERSEVQGSGENYIIRSGLYLHIKVGRLCSYHIVRPTGMEQDNNRFYEPKRVAISSQSIDLKMEISPISEKY